MIDKTLKMSFDTFLRSFTQNKNQDFSFLLGAGCSISSGVPSASNCIWDWKKSLYETNNHRLGFVNIESENDKREIQRWCELQPGFPIENSPKEYSFYVEKAYPLEEDRVTYFENLFKDKVPSIGYKLMVGMIEYGGLSSIWTTNFDNLTLKAAEELNIPCYTIAIENKNTIFNNLIRKGLKYIALHGDYKFSKLKNTEEELYQQESTFVKAMTTHFGEKHLIVIGYSGRDKSLMNALQHVYSQEGGGRLFWLGLESEPNPVVQSLIQEATKAGRKAYYIQAPLFDEAMYQMFRYAFGETEFLKHNIEKFKHQHLTPNITPFTLEPRGTSIQLGTTNLYPVKVPSICYVFGIKVPTQITLWDFLKSKIEKKNIVATIYKGKIYAFGTMSEIYEIFGQHISDYPSAINITYDSYSQIPILKKLVLKAILLGISNNSNLRFNFQGVLWENKQLNDSQNGVQEAIRLSLKTVPKNDFMFLSLSLTLNVDKINFNKVKRQNLIREYTDKLWNKKYYQKLSEWETKIFNNKSILVFNFGNEFKFSISRNCACFKIYGEGPEKLPYGNFNIKRIFYEGIRIPEPKLIFGAPQNTYVSDINPMKGLSENLPFDTSSHVLSPLNIPLGVICPLSKCELFYQFLTSLCMGNIKPHNNVYMRDYSSFQDIYKINLDIPYHRDSPMWIKCRDEQTDGFTLAQNICSAIDRIASINPRSVIVVFIPSNWQSIRSFYIQNIEVDFHDYIKSHCAQNGITTQFIEEKTVYSNMKCEVRWWISLALFVKSGRTPWSLGSLNMDTAYAGIGYSLDNTLGKNVTIIGCSHLYNAQGQGLKFRLRKIDNPLFDDKRNPFLTKEEAYRLGLNIVDLFRDSMYKAPKRVVIHKRTIFKPFEIEGLSNALLPHVEDLELITIESEKDYKALPGSLGQFIIADNYPIQRGTCIPISSNQALLWTHGTLDSNFQGKSYFQGGKGIPTPLKLTRCYGISNIAEIASEILSFTKINWNSFNFYSKFPSTIETSNIVAKLGKLLQHYNGNTFDYKYFI